MKIYSTGEVCNKPGDSDPTKCYNLDPGTENSPPCTQRAGADPGGPGAWAPPPLTLDHGAKFHHHSSVSVNFPLH